jgi:hypothetical protein
VATRNRWLCDRQVFIDRQLTRIEPMRKFLLGLFFLLLVVVVVGLGAAAFWEVPPQQTTMEKTIPNERLSQ